MKKKHLIILATGVILLFALPFVAYYLSPVDASGLTQDFRIEKGLGIREISQSLKSAGLIKSPKLFLIYATLSGSARQLKAGDYKLSKSMSLSKIVSQLEAGPEEDVEIVVKQGDTLADVEKKLVQLKVLPLGKLSKFPGKSLEGFLFPDTYRFFPNSPVSEVVRKFLGNFSDKAMPILSEGCRVRGLGCGERSIYELLIIASIIEKEVPFQEDRYLVAGLLYKRLALGMPLQVDAAPETYDHIGLPKKPIANPGADAIRAAVYPKTSPYLYYLSDPVTKKTIFSKTFEEHKENKRVYLQR